MIYHILATIASGGTLSNCRTSARQTMRYGRGRELSLSFRRVLLVGSFLHLSYAHMPCFSARNSLARAVPNAPEVTFRIPSRTSLRMQGKHLFRKTIQEEDEKIHDVPADAVHKADEQSSLENGTM